MQFVVNNRYSLIPLHEPIYIRHFNTCYITYLLYNGKPVRVGFTTKAGKDGKLQKVRVAKTENGPVVID